MSSFLEVYNKHLNLSKNSEIPYGDIIRGYNLINTKERTTGLILKDGCVRILRSNEDTSNTGIKTYSSVEEFLESIDKLSIYITVKKTGKTFQWTYTKTYTYSPGSILIAVDKKYNPGTVIHAAVLKNGGIFILKYNTFCLVWKDQREYDSMEEFMNFFGLTPADIVRLPCNA